MNNLVSIIMLTIILLGYIGLVWLWLRYRKKQEQAQTNELAAFGIDGIGKITDKRKEIIPAKVAVFTPMFFYFVTYQVILENAPHKNIIMEQRVDRKTYERVTVGETIVIRYSSRNPNLAKIQMR